jgi:RHS repeat-associated protein
MHMPLHSAPRARSRTLAAIAIVALLVSACSPKSTPSPTAPRVTPAPTAIAADLLALDACDLTGYIPCSHQAALLNEPIAGTGVALTYSSEWAPGRKDRSGWDPSVEGLGGWSLDILQRYDSATGVLLSGDGSWRFAKGVTLASGERVVPTYDGLRAYVFDAKGRHVRTVDALLGTTLVTFAYDSGGRLASADGSLDGKSIHLVVERQTDGTLSGLVGFDGVRTALFLDSAGHLGGIRDAAGQASVFTVTADGLVTTYYDPTGGVTTYAYDGSGLLASSTDPDRVATTYARTATATSIEIRSTTALGSVTTYRSEQSGSGRVQTYTGPDGTKRTVSTDATAQHAVALADGTKIAIGEQPDPRWAMDAPIATPVDETRPDGAIRHTTTVIAATATAKDPLAVGVWSRTDVVAGGTWLEKVDPASRTITWSDPAGRTTVQAYDTAGRLISQSAPGQPNLTLSYDDHGRVATRTSGSGAAAAKTTYSYGANGAADIAGPDGVVQHVTADAMGRLVGSTAADGSTVTLGYDALGRLVRVAAAGQPSTTIGLSAAGRQTGFLPPTIGTDGSYETRTYNKDGNLAAIAGPGDRSIAYTYDAMGRITGWVFDQGAATAQYDPTTGLVVKTTASAGIDTAFTYSGRIPIGRSVSGPFTGSVVMTLDSQGRIVGESVDGAAPIAYSFDKTGFLSSVGGVSVGRDAASGAVSQASLGVVQSTREYDSQGRPSHLAVSANGSPAIDVRYAYDLRGRVMSVTEARAGSKPVHTTYAYDTSGRLAGVTVDGTQVESDSYDAAGNRVSVKTPSGTVAATYDDRNRLISWGSAQYAFRADGQLSGITAAGGNSSYIFNSFGDLQEVTLSDGRKIEYLVDSGGARIARKVNGALVAGYLYGADGRLAAQTDAGGAVVARFGYDDAGRLTLVERGSTNYLVVTDSLGSPLLVIDTASGSVVEAITYDAWGNVTSDTSPGFIPIGFAGGLHDADTGLVKFGAREYDPRTGRWTGPDPLSFAGGDPLLYRYAGGDPINLTDPTGLKPFDRNCVMMGDPLCGEYGGSGTGGGVDQPAAYPNGEGGGGSSQPENTPAYNDQPVSSWPIVPHNGYFTGTPPARRPWKDMPILPSQGAAGALCYAFCDWGEPHLRSGDGVPFGFQAAGEFQMIGSPDKSVVIQARTEPFGTSTTVSLTTAVAASVAGDRVAVYASNTVPLTINGKADGRTDLSVRLPHGGIVERHGAVVTIAWPGGSMLQVTRAGGHLDFFISPDAASAPTLRGLLGSADGNPANDFTTRDGTVIDQKDQAFATKLYDPFAASWRITQTESLFDYGPGESTATFTKPDFPHGPATVDSLDASTRAKAEALCRALGVSGEPTLTDCILDVGITGDSSYAASAAAVQVFTATAAAQLPGQSAVLPPTFDKKVSGTIATTSQMDRTTFTAKAGDVIYLDAQGPCASGLTWALIGPSGPSDIGLSYSCTDLGRFVLHDAGTYTVVVNGDGTATGAYAFEIIGAPAEVTSAITVGQTVSDKITRIGEWHAYKFTATAGQIVYLGALGACVSGLTWRIVDPSGKANLGNACDNLGRFVLSDAGNYTIEVYSDGTATGAYRFQLRSSP